MVAKVHQYRREHVTHQTLSLLGKKCSFVSAAVKQSGGNWELQRPMTTAFSFLIMCWGWKTVSIADFTVNAFDQDRGRLQWNRLHVWTVLSIFDDTECNFKYRKDLMIFATKWGKNIHLSIGINYRPNELQNRSILAKNPISCILTEDLTDQWMQHFPFIYQTDWTTAMAFHL